MRRKQGHTEPTADPVLEVVGIIIVHTIHTYTLGQAARAAHTHTHTQLIVQDAEKIRATLHLIGHFHSRTQRTTTQTPACVYTATEQRGIRGEFVFVRSCMCVCACTKGRAPRRRRRTATTTTIVVNVLIRADILNMYILHNSCARRLFNMRIRVQQLVNLMCCVQPLLWHSISLSHSLPHSVSVAERRGSYSHVSFCLHHTTTTD